MDCTHIQTIANLPPPRLSQSVHREECTQCFDDQDSPLGIDVCLVCFNGGCLTTDRHHAQTHVKKSGHKFTLNVKRKRKPSSPRAEGEEPPAKMTKLAIIEEREEDKYDTFTTAKCWLCDSEKGKEISQNETESLKPLVNGVMSSLSSARQSEVKAWEEEITPCEHTLMLEQHDAGKIAESGLAHCKSCDLKENLWLCLTCGSLGCGRKQFGGVPGGNGHQLEHFEATGHAVCVKLGTITAEGEADIYCYKCNDAKQDPDLKSHLAAFGINVGSLTKTEKSMTELQIEQNLRYDFSLLSEDGKALQPVFGPGLTGLANLGNSCYMASVLQTLFALPSFKKRYYDSYHQSAAEHAESCDAALPGDCFECQMVKVADGLLSGRYSHPENTSSLPLSHTAADHLQHESPTPVFQKGIRPMGFKRLVGKGHEEFATMRQQDSEEFLGWLVSVIRRDLKKYSGVRGEDPSTVFSYALQQRLQCGECKKVRYRTDEQDVLSVAVPAFVKKKDEGEMSVDGEKTEYEEVQLVHCVDGVLGTEGLDYACPSCEKNVMALKQTKFASFPEVLVVHAKKFQLVNWVPAKLDIPIVLPPNDLLEFTADHQGTGLQPGEETLPEDSASGSSGAPALPEFNQAAMEQLQMMGFPEIRCKKALLATGNSDADAAMEWLFGHMEDPDIDDPIIPKAPSQTGGSAGPEPSAEQVGMLVDMGFTTAQAKKALRETSGNAERAVEWLFSHPEDTGLDDAPAPSSSADAAPKQLPGTTDVPVKYRLKAFISHKGPSVHSGHYVAHIKVTERGEVDEGWVLFNDEKVVKADKESVKDLKRLAYLYVFERD